MFIFWTLGIILRIVDVAGNAVAWICFVLFAIFSLASIMTVDGWRKLHTVGFLFFIGGFISMVLGPMWLSLDAKLVIGFAVCAALLAAFVALAVIDERRGSLVEEG